MVYAKQNYFGKALDTLMEGLKWHEQNPDFHYAISICLLKSGKPKEAYEILEKALVMNYDSHQKIFKSFPDLRDNQVLTGIIEGYRGKDQ